MPAAVVQQASFHSSDLRHFRMVSTNCACPGGTTGVTSDSGRAPVWNIPVVPVPPILSS